MIPSDKQKEAFIELSNSDYLICAYQIIEQESIIIYLTLKKLDTYVNIKNTTIHLTIILMSRTIKKISTLITL